MNSEFPDIIDLQKKDTNSVTLEILVRNDVKYFQGHFEDFPILPGVVQVHWAIHFAKKNLNIEKCYATRLSNIKFVRFICPGEKIKLHIFLNRNKSLINYSYYGDQFKYSSGTIYL